MEYIPFSDIAVDDKNRSSYMFKNIFQENNSMLPPNSNNPIPRHIVQYWDDKIVPNDVKVIMDSWEESDLDRSIYNNETALEFIIANYDKQFVLAFQKCIHPAMRADYFRLCYLYKKGGIYIDADDLYNCVSLKKLFKNNYLKLYPLCYDVESNQMVELNEFYYKSYPNKNYIYYVNNDPIVCPQNHQLIKLALSKATFNLLSKDDIKRDIQSVSGPGVLSASVVQYHINCKKNGNLFDVDILTEWDSISTPQWNLSYKNDQRNWRIWSGKNM